MSRQGSPNPAPPPPPVPPKPALFSVLPLRVALLLPSPSTRFWSLETRVHKRARVRQVTQGALLQVREVWKEEVKDWLRGALVWVLRPPASPRPPVPLLPHRG